MPRLAATTLRSLWPAHCTRNGGLTTNSHFVRRTVAFLTFALLLPAGARSADRFERFATPSPTAIIIPGLGPLATAARQAAHVPLKTDRATPPFTLQSADPAAAQKGRSQSWIGRHPALFGALVGAGTGAVVGAIAGHAQSDEWFTRRENFVLVGASVGAGGGALVGWIAGAARD